MRTRWLRWLVAMPLGLGVMATAGVALAHGERSQEGFLRMQTAAFYDVQFSNNSVKQGEAITVTGKVKVLETWPATLKAPEVGYINVIAPGPTFIMRERTINGQAAPGSIFLNKGGVYEFKMVLEGRRPGTWHLHPVLYVEGSGGLIGPGQWTTVAAVPGGYRNLVTLLSGEQVDLEQYGYPLVFWFSFAGFVLGVAWMLWWTIRHRTVTNLAVTSQIGLNDPGEDIGLITRADHRVSTALAGLTLALLVGGYLYMDAAYPTRIPQQVRRFTPAKLPEPPALATAQVRGATFDPGTGALTMEAQVANLGREPLQITGFTTSSLTFRPQGPGPVLRAEPATVAPGQTAVVKLTVQDRVWAEERLITAGRSELAVAGLLMVESAGQRNLLTVSSPVIPTNLTASLR